MSDAPCKKKGRKVKAQISGGFHIDCGTLPLCSQGQVGSRRTAWIPPLYPLRRGRYQNETSLLERFNFFIINFRNKSQPRRFLSQKIIKMVLRMKVIFKKKL